MLNNFPLNLGRSRLSSWRFNSTILSAVPTDLRVLPPFLHLKGSFFVYAVSPVDSWAAIVLSSPNRENRLTNEDRLPQLVDTPFRGFPIRSSTKLYDWRDSSGCFVSGKGHKELATYRESVTSAGYCRSVEAITSPMISIRESIDLDQDASLDEVERITLR